MACRDETSRLPPLLQARPLEVGRLHGRACADGRRVCVAVVQHPARPAGLCAAAIIIIMGLGWLLQCGWDGWRRRRRQRGATFRSIVMRLGAGAAAVKRLGRRLLLRRRRPLFHRLQLWRWRCHKRRRRPQGSGQGRHGGSRRPQRFSQQDVAHVCRAARRRRRPPAATAAGAAAGGPRPLELVLLAAARCQRLWLPVMVTQPVWGAPCCCQGRSGGASAPVCRARQAAAPLRKGVKQEQALQPPC